MNALKLVAAAAVSVVALTSPAAHAALGLDVTSGTGAGTCGASCATGKTLGWSFAASSTLRIDGLGVWDDSADGLIRNTEVGLWDSAGTLLASTTVTNASARLSSANLSGEWKMQGITALTLAPGNYVIGSVYDVNDDLVLLNPSFTTAAGVTLLQGVQNLLVDGLQFPTTLRTTGPAFGATFQISPVPEPQAIALMASGLAVLALIGARRRKASTTVSG
jgi:PEP-CTERM motif